MILLQATCTTHKDFEYRRVGTYYVVPGGSGIPSTSCTGVSYSVQGWSIVSVHTENVSTKKFSKSWWHPTSKRDTPQGPYVQIENDNIWFDLPLSICVLPKVTLTFVHASLFHNMVNIFCPSWQTIVRTNCFGTRVIDRNLALSTVEKEWESLRKYEKLLFSLVRLRKFEII
jgi:hypothetical protein